MFASKAQIEKLPKWAQDEIRSRDREIETLKEEVADLRGQPIDGDFMIHNVMVGIEDDKRVPIAKGSRIIIPLEGEMGGRVRNELSIRRIGPSLLEIMGTAYKNEMFVRPWAANVFHIGAAPLPAADRR